LTQGPKQSNGRCDSGRNRYKIIRVNYSRHEYTRKRKIDDGKNRGASVAVSSTSGLKTNGFQKTITTTTTPSPPPPPPPLPPPPPPPPPLPPPLMLIMKDCLRYTVSADDGGVSPPALEVAVSTKEKKGSVEQGIEGMRPSFA